MFHTAIHGICATPRCPLRGRSEALSLFQIGWWVDRVPFHHSSRKCPRNERRVREMLRSGEIAVCGAGRSDPLHAFHAILSNKRITRDRNRREPNSEVGTLEITDVKKSFLTSSRALIGFLCRTTASAEPAVADHVMNRRVMRRTPAPHTSFLGESDVMLNS